MSGIHPTALRVVDDRSLLIEWSDGQRRRYSFGQLRRNCPCASCHVRRAEERPSGNALPVLAAAPAAPVRITGMKPAGSYAYSIEFNDGHNTGIYTFELLRELGELERTGD
ncbi:MAG: DUF971 domain-containing protein [Planctomycetes bacterium]|nr:DUF971 domain-containing protein [Planctomycetota bacterium]